MAGLCNRQFASLCVIGEQCGVNFPSRHSENMEVCILVYLESAKDIRQFCD